MKTKILLSTAIIAILALTGCGSSSSDTPAKETPPTPTANNENCIDDGETLVVKEGQTCIDGEHTLVCENGTIIYDNMIRSGNTINMNGRKYTCE